MGTNGRWPEVADVGASSLAAPCADSATYGPEPPLAECLRTSNTWAFYCTQVSGEFKLLLSQPSRGGYALGNGSQKFPSTPCLQYLLEGRWGKLGHKLREFPHCLWVKTRWDNAAAFQPSTALS